MEGKRLKFSLLAHFLLTLTLPEVISSLSYPILPSKRFGRVGSPHLPALVPMTFAAAARIPADLEVPDYDDNYTPFSQMDENDKYPLAPIYGYVEDQPIADPFVDYEEEPYEERVYPYGRETWFKEVGDEDENEEDKIAFLRHLILAERDRDQEADSKIVYGTPVEFSPEYEDDERDETWYYGVPVYEARDDARSRKEDSVRELESLTRQMKAEEAKAMKNEEMVPLMEDEVLRNQLHKQISRSGRKNSIPLRDGFKMNEKRSYPGEKSDAKTGSRQGYHANGKDMAVESKKEVTTAVPQQKTSQTGQKEYVLPRPASPLRKPLQRGIHTRSTEKGNVYQAIKKLLAMEEKPQKENRPRIQKRFVLSEDQLTSQLSGLKRIAV